MGITQIYTRKRYAQKKIEYFKHLGNIGNELLLWVSRLLFTLSGTIAHCVINFVYIISTLFINIHWFVCQLVTSQLSRSSWLILYRFG